MRDRIQEEAARAGALAEPVTEFELAQWSSGECVPGVQQMQALVREVQLSREERSKR